MGWLELATPARLIGDVDPDEFAETVTARVGKAASSSNTPIFIIFRIDFSRW